jgi:hypothetical protein
MATATFLSGATCNITPTGGAAVDVSDQLSKCEVMLGFELLESTSLADTGRQAVKGLQSVAVNLDLYLSYGATEMETLLSDIVAAGSCTIVVSPSGTVESASNPEFTITTATLGCRSGHHVVHRRTRSRLNFVLQRHLGTRHHLIIKRGKQ